MSIELKKRFDRIVDILVQLQSKRVVKAQELADRFEVSLRTIYRDIKSLEQAGVPLIGEAGTGYSIMEGYRLPPVSFSREEALSFVATEKLAQKFLDKESSQRYSAALLKIKAILKSNDKDLLSSIEDQIVMKQQAVPLFLDQVPHILSSALEAISLKKQFEVNYQGIRDEQAMARTIEPIGIVHESGFWYIVAYCLKRQDFRQFRSDRFESAKITETNFSKNHISIANYLAQKKQDERPKSLVKLSVKREIASHLRWERNYYGFVKEIVGPEWVEMHFQSPDLDLEFPRWLMMFADHVRSIEPERLRRQVISLLEESLNTIKKQGES